MEQEGRPDLKAGIKFQLPHVEPREQGGILGDIGRKINLLGINTANEFRYNEVPVAVEKDVEYGGLLLRYKKSGCDVCMRVKDDNSHTVTQITVQKSEKGVDTFTEIKMGDYPRYFEAVRKKDSTNIRKIDGHGSEETKIVRLQSQKGKEPHRYLQVKVECEEAGANFMQAKEAVISVGDATVGVQEFTDLQSRTGVDRIRSLIRSMKNKDRVFSEVVFLDPLKITASNSALLNRMNHLFIFNEKLHGEGQIAIGGIVMPNALNTDWAGENIRPASHPRKDPAEDLLGHRDLGRIRIPEGSISALENWRLPQSILQ